MALLPAKPLFFSVLFSLVCDFSVGFHSSVIGDFGFVFVALNLLPESRTLVDLSEVVSYAK